MDFNYIPQTNSYNCGVVALMNAFNYSGLANFKIGHIPWVERTLHADKDYGVEEKDMIKIFRNAFKVTIRKKLDTDFLNKWLAAGNQAIVLYPYSFETNDYHFANIFGQVNSCYFGANFWWHGDCGKWYFSKKLQSSVINKLMNIPKDNVRRIIYLRLKTVVL
jgi:hypothetical protein